VWLMEEYFLRPWREFIRLWIKENWKSKKFTDDVDLILLSVTGGLNGVRMFHRLEGSVDEIYHGIVPKQVCLLCKEYLLNGAVQIKKHELEGAGDYYQPNRDELKLRFGIFKSSRS